MSDIVYLSGRYENRMRVLPPQPLPEDTKMGIFHKIAAETEYAKEEAEVAVLRGWPRSAGQCVQCISGERQGALRGAVLGRSRRCSA